MKKHPLLLALLFLVSLSYSAMANTIVEGPFDEIRVSGKLRLVLQPGDTESVNIDTDEDKVSVEIRSGVLHLKRKARWKFSSYKKSIEVQISYKQIRSISADAGAEISSAYPLVSPNALRLNFGSGAQADLEVKTEGLEINTGEGAQIELEGYASEMTAKATTGGILEAFDLQCSRVFVKANTGGQIEVTAIEQIEAKATTGGQIDYRGNPKQSYVSDELGGNVKHDSM